MKPKNYEVLMDIYMGVLNAPAIQFTTEDFGMCQITFSLLEDRITPYNLSNCIVRMVINGQQQDCTISDANNGKAEIVLLQSMFTEVGFVTAELQIYDATNQTMRLTTPTFKYTVRKSLMDDNTVQADANYSILQQMILNVSNADKVSSEALKLSKEAKAICDDLVPKANTAAQNAQTALDRAESVVTQEELAQKVMLGGTAQTKFDFIEDKVVQDGLVYLKDTKITETTFTTKILDTSGDFTVLLELGTPSNGSTPSSFLYQGTGVQGGYVVNISSSFTLRLGVSDGSQFVYTGSNKVDKEPMKLVLSRNNNIIRLFSLDGKHNIEADCSTMNNKSNYTTISASYAPIDYIAIYERTLTSKEIKHNFSVLDNSSSIKELHTTDSAGKTSILNLASSEDFVEMSTGRTLREEYMSVLKTIGKEFTSADGSPVTVNNGIEARVISAEIKGQTVKNYCAEYGNVTDKVWVANGQVKYLRDGFYSNTHIYQGVKQSFLSTPLENGKKYTLIFEVIKNDLTEACSVQGSVFNVANKFNAKETGVKRETITYLSNMTNINLFYTLLPANTPQDSFQYRFMIIEGDGSNVNTFFMGLSSTQATISNNGQQFPIYANEEDKANKKVISLPFPEDKLILNEDGSATWIDASNRKTLNNNEPWIKSSVQNAEANCFQIEIIDADNNGNSVIVFCDKLESVTGASTLSAGTLKPNTCGIDGSRYLRVGVPKTVDTVEQMKEFAQNLNIIYRSKIQEITHIDKSIVPTILTHKTNILEAGGAVKPSSFKVTLPVDRIAEIEARLQALESTTVDVVLNK